MYIVCTYPSILKIHAVNRFLALSMALKMSSREAIPICSNGINTVATNDCQRLVVLAYMYMGTLVLHDLGA